MFAIIGLTVGSSTTANAFTILANGGITPKGSSIQMWQGFSYDSKVALADACMEWNNKCGKGTMIVKDYYNDTSHNYYPYNDGINQVFKTSTIYTYLMQTHNWVGTGWDGRLYIFQADINVNANQPWANGSYSDRFDVQNVLTHEIGHCLGLDHTTVSGATMISGSWMGMISKRTIETDDINGAKSIY